MIIMYTIRTIHATSQGESKFTEEQFLPEGRIYSKCANYYRISQIVKYRLTVFVKLKLKKVEFTLWTKNVNAIHKKLSKTPWQFIREISRKGRLTECTYTQPGISQKIGRIKLFKWSILLLFQTPNWCMYKLCFKLYIF